MNKEIMAGPPQSLRLSGKAAAASIPLLAVRMTAKIVSKLCKEAGSMQVIASISD